MAESPNPVPATPADAPPAPVRRIDRYEIHLPELGKGGMGVVYKGFDPRIGRQIAIKTIPTTVTPDHEHFEEFRRRLFREAQAAGTLNHPHIVTVYDVGEAEGQLFIVMELVDGRSFDKVIRSGEPPALPEVFRYVEQVGLALDYAHVKGIVHRDVKPANLILGTGGIVKVADFGIAKLPTSTITQEGGRLGSPSYMSPEQVDGRGIDGRSDIWSLGVVLYQLLTGEKPFKGSTVAAITHQIVNGTFVPPSELNPRLPRRIDRILDKALQKEPERRFQTGAQLAAELAKLPLDDLRGIRLYYPRKDGLKDGARDGGKDGGPRDNARENAREIARENARRAREHTPVPPPSQIEGVFQNLTYSARSVGVARRMDWKPWAVALAAGGAAVAAALIMGR